MSKQLKRVSITKDSYLDMFNQVKDDNGLYYDSQVLEFLLHSYYQSFKLKRTIQTLEDRIEMLK